MEAVICISLICVGIRMITDEGKILYFLRKPFDKIMNQIHEQQNLEKEKFHLQNWLNLQKDRSPNVEEEIRETEERLEIIKRIEVLSVNPYRFKWLIHIFKPVHLCVVCMASVHTFAWWLCFNDHYSIQTIYSTFMVAALNGIIWALYLLIRKYAK